MARVTILTHSEFTHAKSGVKFEPTKVQTAEGPVILGVAEVADDVAREHFAKHSSFSVEGLADEPKSPAGGEGGETPVKLDTLKVAELQALADERKVTVTGTGAAGKVTKADLVAAIEAHDAAAKAAAESTPPAE